MLNKERPVFAYRYIKFVLKSVALFFYQQLPELIEYFERGNALMMFLASNGGIFLGFLAMALLAIYEGQIVINKD